jgi:hypothetical protein
MSPIGFHRLIQRLGEIAKMPFRIHTHIHPERIGVDDRDHVAPDGGVVPQMRQKIRDPSVHRRMDLGLRLTCA